MASKLNITTLVSGLIIAVAVGSMIMVSYVVPSWYKKPKPPQPTTHDCQRNLDCDQDFSCLNGKCTKVEKPPAFPWLTVGITIFIITLVIFLFSAGTVARAPNDQKQQLSKSLLVRSVILLFGLLIIVLISYVIYKTRYLRQCPEKPRDQCPTGMINICDENTGFTWQCISSEDACGGNKPQCDKGPAQCNASTLKWECPTKVCSKDPPKGFNCPPKKDGVLYKPRCDAGTEFEWICQPGCDPKGSAPSCATGTHPGCNVDTNYKWACVKNSSNVCGTTIKPACDGAMCIDTSQGWDWKCPGDLTRDDVIRMNKLSCGDYNNEDDSSNQVNICFTDSTHKIPIHPTIGYDCSKNTNATQSLGLDLDKVLANPAGNMKGGNDKNQVFQPMNKTKRLYYQPNSDSPTLCVLSDNHNYICQNGGEFIQDKPDISKTGHCKCIADKDDILSKGTAMFKGDKCQFSNRITCHEHGNVDEQGKCSECLKQYSGPDCNCSNDVCSGHGKIVNPNPTDCNCTCDNGFISCRDTSNILMQCYCKTSDNCYTTGNVSGDDYCSNYRISCGDPTCKNGGCYKSCDD